MGQEGSALAIPGLMISKESSSVSLCRAHGPGLPGGVREGEEARALGGRFPGGTAVGEPRVSSPGWTGANIPVPSLPCCPERERGARRTGGLEPLDPTLLQLRGGEGDKRGGQRVLGMAGLGDTWKRGVPAAGCTMVEVTVTPQSSLADRPVQIRVRGLSPSQLVTLRAWLKDEQGECFQSRAFFRADGAGEVDPGLHAALGGSYSGVWPMGLFWFLQPDTLFRRLVKRDVAGSPFRVRLEVFDGLSLGTDLREQPLGSCEAERWYVGPGVQRVPIREGRVRGALFLPPGPGPFPGVIDLFGGAGGLIEFRAGLLASRGFAVLALAFFAYDDLPRVLAQLDLEYFEEAAELLLRHPKVRGPGLGVVGVSKGAEVALAMATFLPQVVATVWINGTSFLYGNPLVYKELRIPAIPYYTERVLFTEVGAMDNSAIFTDPRDPARQASAIPVEKIRGKVLFVVGEADRSFNSKLFAELALARMPPESGRILSYPGAGHLIEPPGSPLCSNSSIRGTPKPVAWGGELQPHARAQEHSWQEILQFLELHLGSVAAMKL
ncbi:acyl-coenzyme A amino acid N-acyltransferase 2-like isoform X1 [Pyrgilauda ruficollis]|uniref:acyl-coenzyme A amino acid N-acyltransferase 2-like isoform X1 n=2 Tax=Pyrgilauda ruficollis TaxID=221976 RepID=UPI001B865B44|nr:acyl-coenzyme A amino acid N-acyltransferase 2-like isoform X1 [Pyrgilauda ruficollis]